METRINEDELALLTWLHENAKGYGDAHPYNAVPIAVALGFDHERFERASSYLGEWQLIGRNRKAVTRGEPIAPVYLTGAGEAYMREVDERAAAKGAVEKGKRIGLGVLSGLGQAARDTVIATATAVLTEYVRQRAGLP